MSTSKPSAWQVCATAHVGRGRVMCPRFGTGSSTTAAGCVANVSAVAGTVRSAVRLLLVRNGSSGRH